MSIIQPSSNFFQMGLTQSYDAWKANHLQIRSNKSYLQNVDIVCNKQNVQLSDAVVESFWKARIQYIPYIPLVCNPFLVESFEKCKPIYMYYFQKGYVDFDEEMQLVYIYHHFIRQCKSTSVWSNFASSFMSNPIGMRNKLESGELFKIYEQIEISKKLERWYADLRPSDSIKNEIK